ncbi:serine/threonine-protein kinase WNK1-like [Cynoglossus semilaevis]|uniref:serine/threonine-protein kinase WNK1-like n=1 Tax=Cynoglossus semilaevis TaxID=244447 RepID=UPI0007DC93E9|nr:serine/threonine-protein kinase WNK1-like [Cynoglossus semilaevis]
MKEIQALQSRQREEIESLFVRLGKPPPPSVFSPAVGMIAGRRRLKSKTYKSSRSSGQPSPNHTGSPSKQRPPTSEFVGAGLETLQTDELTVQQIHFSPSMPSLSDYKAGMCQDKVQ